MAAEGQSERMVSDMEVCMKQSCGTKLLHVDKMAPTDTCCGCENSEVVLGVFQKWHQELEIQAMFEMTMHMFHLCWCRSVQTQHVGSCLSLVKMSR